MNTYTSLLKNGGIIAYPTEAVFGLGCDPLNEQAVKKILQLKHRDVKKGLIIVGATWEQLKPFTQSIPPDRLQTVLSTWPGPITWVFPASRKAPRWITGHHSTLAIRVSAHPVVHTLCEAWNGPLVSTSANPESLPPARTEQQVKEYFSQGLDAIVPGHVGLQQNPTEIRDALTGKILRPNKPPLQY